MLLAAPDRGTRQLQGNRLGDVDDERFIQICRYVALELFVLCLSQGAVATNAVEGRKQFCNANDADDDFGGISTMPGDCVAATFIDISLGKR